MGTTRRTFVKTAGAWAAAGLALDLSASPKANRFMEPPTNARPLFVSTWPFGKPGNEKGLKVFESGGSLLDALEQGIGLVEADPENAYVGLAGIPAANGVVQLDACIMWGPTHAGGSVAALEGIVHPISVARRVMETTPHVMLAGEGARQFAIREGFQSGPLVSPKQQAAWRRWQAERAATSGKIHGHDTIALLALGPDGAVAGGCSTSGLGYKMNGRVGDSPILGSGLYVDNDVGAAGATGVGENVMRYCGTFMVVELMSQGRSPQQACEEAIRRIARKDPRAFNLSIHFIAMNKEGQFGGAGTNPHFTYAVTTPEKSELRGGSLVQS